MPELNPAIQEVTVFTNRARLTRRGTIALEPGSQPLTIPNLPLTLDPASVRARAQGTARAKLLGVDVKKTYFKDTPPGRALELTEQIRALEENDRQFIDQSDTLDKQIVHLDGLAGNTKTFAVSLSRGRTTPEAHAELLKFISAQRLTAQTQKRALETQRRNLAQELDKLRKELQALQSARPKERYAATIELEVSQAGELEVELSYIQHGAMWQPMYDVRLAEGQLEIAYLGQVSQSSGEDWTGVTLTLSTASPALAGVVPELQPWYVAPAYPEPVARMAPKGRGMPQIFAAQATDAMAPQALAAAPAPVEQVELAEVLQAEISQEGATVTYKVGEGIDIPGDNTPRKNTIALFPLPLKLEYVIAPRLVSAAYRKMTATNNTPYMLLPGTVQLFDRDDYVGQSRIERTTSGQEIELYFGTDDRFKVERELVKRETDKKLLGDQRRIRFAYEIEVQNHTGEPQTVFVHDQIPVSRHENIKVKLDACEPKVTEQDELNRLVWKLTLPAGGKQMIRYEFVVEAPREMQVIGLP